jgi:hypothetical protein
MPVSPAIMKRSRVIMIVSALRLEAPRTKASVVPPRTVLKSKRNFLLVCCAESIQSLPKVPQMAGIRLQTEIDRGCAAINPSLK